MDILFTGRKAHLTGSLREFAEERLKRLARVLEGAVGAHVVLTLEKHRHLAEIVVNGRRATFTARAEAADFRDSLGACIDRLVVQARRRRERVRKERKRRGARASPRRPGAPLPEGAEVAATLLGGEDGAGIVRMGRMPAKPMSIAEALLQARVSRQPVVIFRNRDSQQLVVLFRRPDGRYGLVEAES